jgi:uncharacterized membrane-anchored protein YitT (DUF2179 family)
MPATTGTPPQLHTPTERTMLGIIKRVFWILLAVLSATFGIQGFLIPNGFIDGGITGISMLISYATGTDLALLIGVLNIPFILMGWREMGGRFAVKAAACILFLTVVVHELQIPPITHEKILAAVFGGFFLGAGIGLAIRSSSVIDGTEILSLSLSKRTGITVGDLVLLINLVIFSGGFFVLDSVENVCYSMLTYFSASKTINFLLHGLEQYTGITIISNAAEAIRYQIVCETGRGVTIYQGRGGFSGQPQDILFCVVTRLEIPAIKTIVESQDPRAFFLTHTLNEASGGMVRNGRVTI